MQKRFQAALLSLVVLLLGAGLAEPSSALEVGCGRSACVGGGLDFDLQKAPNLHLAGTLTFHGRSPFGFGATVLGELAQPLANEGVCQASGGRSLCLSRLSQPSSAHRGVYALRFRFGPDRTQPAPNVNAIPEPSAALIFGVGLLVASGLVMRTGELE